MRLALTRIAAPPNVPHRHFLRPGSAADPAGATGPATGLYPGEPEHCRRSLRPLPAGDAPARPAGGRRQVYNLGRGFQLLLAVAAVGLPVHYLLPFRWKKPSFVAISVVGLGWVFGGPTPPWSCRRGGASSASAWPPAALDRQGRRRAWRRPSALALVRAGGDRGRPAGAGPAGPRHHVHVPDHHLPLRAEARQEARAGHRRAQLLLPAAELLLPPLPGRRLPDDAARLLRRRGPRRPAGRPADDAPRLRPPAALPLPRPRVADRPRPRSAARGPSRGSSPGTTCSTSTSSGQFHVACGMLHLFGFKLPETHHHYLLATGFTDYWRRINIYWKDFMVRVFFNPVAFRLKRRPQWQALAAATVVVFLATWFLHAYQIVLARAAAGASAPPDALFWGIAGGPRAGQRPARRPPRPGPVAVERPPRRCPVAGRAWSVRSRSPARWRPPSLLWSLWTSPSVSELAGDAPPRTRRRRDAGPVPSPAEPRPDDGTMAAEPRSLLPQLALTAALLAWGLAPDRPVHGLAEARPTSIAWTPAIMSTCPTSAAASMPRPPTPPPPPFKDGPLALKVGDLRECVLSPVARRRPSRAPAGRPTPSASATATTRRAKPAGTTRVVLLGDSIGVGWGVDDGEGFEPRLERSLDRAIAVAGRPRRRGPQPLRPGLRARPAVASTCGGSAGRSAPTSCSSRRPPPTWPGTSGDCGPCCPRGSAGTSRCIATS